MLANEIMTKDVAKASEHTSIELGEALTTAMHVRHLPIVNDNDELVGVVSVRDLLAHFAHNGKDQRVLLREIMTDHPIAAAPSTPVKEIISLLLQHEICCVPILDGGKLVGIVTERDIVGFAACRV